MANENIIEPYQKRFNQLKEHFESYRSHFIDITNYTLPRKGRYLVTEGTTQNNDGQKKHQKIINGIAGEALRILSAGMQGGLTSPSRPWFLLTLADEGLTEFSPVREWLHMVRNGMLAIFSRSNFYGVIHSLYAELANYGTAVMLIEEDFKTIIRCRPFTIGEFYLAANDQHRIDTLYRQFALTARQLVTRFGLNNVSTSVKSAYDAGQGENLFKVYHCIQPNIGKDRDKGIPLGMPFASIYWEDGASENKFLSRNGYRELPFVAPRWDVTGVDVYGNSPGMASLGDIKMLQKMEEKTLKALDKSIDPPMNADSSMRRQGGSIIPGGVNYIDGMTQGNKGFSPAYQIQPDFRNIEFKIERTEERIKRGFFNDLFLSIIGTDKRMTATEVAERHEEKLLMLGPVLERLQSELLDVIIDRTFNIMSDMNLLPPIPQELRGMEIKTEYISLLAQAQKLVGTTSIEQTVGFVGNLAATFPEAIDKLDADEAIDQYADAVGVPPKIIRSDDTVERIRFERQQAAQQAAQQEQMAQMVEGAKVLSETDTGENNALTELMAGAI